MNQNNETTLLIHNHTINNYVLIIKNKILAEMRVKYSCQVLNVKLSEDVSETTERENKPKRNNK